MSSRAVNFKRYKELQDALEPSEFHGLRYIFGAGFSKMDNVVEIYRELVLRRGVSDEDASNTIDDCMIACGYKSLLQKQCSDSFKISGSFFSRDDIETMQARAVCVKVVKHLDERNKWKDFLGYTNKKNIKNMPDDKFDDLREMESKKDLCLKSFKLFKEILDLMEENSALDIIDAYQQENELDLSDTDEQHCSDKDEQRCGDTSMSYTDSGKSSEDDHIIFNKVTSGSLIVGNTMKNIAIMFQDAANINGSLIDNTTIINNNAPSSASHSPHRFSRPNMVRPEQPQ